MICFDFSSPPDGFAGRIAVGLFLLMLLDAIWLKSATGACFNAYPLHKQSAEQAEHTRRHTVPAVVTCAIVGSLVGAGFNADSTSEAFGMGSLLGFFAFFLFNVTTFVLQKDWTCTTIIFDTIYGCIAYGCVFAAQHAVA